MLFISQLKGAAAVLAASVLVTGSGIVIAQQLTAETKGPQVDGNSPARQAMDRAVAAEESAKRPTPQTATATKMVSLTDIISLSVDQNGLHARWIAPTSPENFGEFDTTAPALHWVTAAGPQAHGGDADLPGNFRIDGVNRAPTSPAEPTLFTVRTSGDVFWIREYYSKDKLAPAFVEYIQDTNSVRFIRRAWLNEQQPDPAQQTDIKAATFAELKAQMGGKLEEYLAPLLAQAGMREPFRPVVGDLTKVFKPIDQSQSGFYADGLWSYSYNVGNSPPQGALKYDTRDLLNPQPGDFILTPWGWMQWQDRQPNTGNWLPVAEKPPKGKQLPDPATHPEIISRPPPAP